MNKLNLKGLLSLIAVLAIVMTSCSKKMDPLSNNLFNANPSPLELVGTKVPVTINGKFPAKWFLKNATVTLTPVIKYNGGEVLGESQSYQGEKVSGNGIVVRQEQGSAITLNSSFDYNSAMAESELYLRFNVKIGNKEVTNIPDLKLADGVLATAALANAYSTEPSFAPDAFQRIIKEVHDANILFLIQSADLRADQLNKNSIDAWKDIVKEAFGNDRKNLDLEISAYASPDGGLDLNEKLAAKREKNTSTYLSKELKRNSIEKDVNAHYTAQDWEGFQKLVQASSLQDKNLVLSVLSMYNNPVEREREIKNISTVYSELADNVLPLLRRSRLIANVEIIGKSNDELVEATKGDMSDLSLEELLYAANLEGVNAEKVYQTATKKYPSDYRTWNNLGALYFAKGDTDRAKENFNKAKRLSTRTIEANMNLALLEMANENFSAAEELLGSAAGANNLNQALGLLYIKKGQYKQAEDAFGEAKTNNAAISQILNKNYNKAQKTLDAVQNKDGYTSYLLAIVSARTNNVKGVVSNLTDAMSKGVPTVKIAGDREFAKFLTNPEVENLLRKY